MMKQNRLTPIPILMYHNIDVPADKINFRGLYVHPSSFKRQMRYLALNGYQALSMTQLMPYLRGERHGKVVGLSFDDGYLDNLQHAAPVLQHYGFSATCYLVADRLGEYNRWDAKQIGIKKPLMNKQQVGKWLDAGMEIGSHGLTHCNLTNINHSQLTQEIADSKYRLEQEFSVPVDHFCYPYGAYDLLSKEQVQIAGYRSAVTTRRGRVVQGDCDLWQLPRVLVARSTWLYLFAMKIQGGYEDRRRSQAIV